MAGWPQDNRTLTSFSATRKLICAWGDRTFLRAFFMLHPGQLYPYALEYGARVVGVGMEPFGQQNQDPGGVDLALYAKALLTVRYETPAFGTPQAYPASKDPLKNLDRASVISETLEGSTEATRLDHADFVWSDDTELKEEEAPVRVMRRATYVLTRHNLPNIPQSFIDLAGKINDAAISPILVGMDTLTFAAQTLFMGDPVVNISNEDDAANNGRRSFDLTMRMEYRPETWRQYWNAESESFLKIHHRNTDGSKGAEYTEPAEADFSIVQP